MTERRPSRAPLVLSVAALTVALAGVGAPSVAKVYRAINADTVDGFHAVKASASKKKRKHRLVAADKKGRAPDAARLGGLKPGAFVRVNGKAANADRLDGLDSTAFLPATGTAANADALGGRGPSGYVASASALGLVAAGTVSDAGVLQTGTAGVSTVQASTGVYEIAIAGVTYTGGDFITVATFLGGATGSLASGASGGSLRITSKDVAGTLDNAGFSFVVLRTG